MVAVFALEPKTYNSFINFLWFHSKKCILLTRPSLNLVKRSTRNNHICTLIPCFFSLQALLFQTSNLLFPMPYPRMVLGYKEKQTATCQMESILCQIFAVSSGCWWLFFGLFFLLLPSVTVLGSHNEKLPLCLFTSSSSLNVTLVRDESPARKKTKTLFIFLSQIFPSWVCLILTSLVFQRWRSLGREEHLGRHSSSFLGR